jgi:hypothetical protein
MANKDDIGYFNFDKYYGDRGEVYSVHAYKNLKTAKKACPMGASIEINDINNIKADKFYDIKRYDGCQIIVSGSHLLNVHKRLNRMDIPLEAIIECRKKNKWSSDIHNLSYVTQNNIETTLPISDGDMNDWKKHSSVYPNLSKYDFDLGFIDSNDKIEVKTDRQTLDTGNIFVEYSQCTHPDVSGNDAIWNRHSVKSGIHISEADWWLYVISPEVILKLHPSILHKIHKWGTENKSRIKEGGANTTNDRNPRTRGVLVSVQLVLGLDLRLRAENNFRL